MKPETIPGFDCLEFKRKVQAEIYEKTKNMTVEEQIEYFRQAAANGPFADLWKRIARTPRGEETSRTGTIKKS